MGALLLTLCGRLFYIQILCGDELAEAAASQYATELIGIDDRGQIFDRDLRPLTGERYRCYYIIKKALTDDADLMRLLEEIDAERITAASSRYEVFQSERFDAEVHKRLQQEYNAYGFRKRARYQSDQTACHLIGYLNEDEQRGVAGLELLCENRLRSKGGRLILQSDAAGNLLRGIAPRKLRDSDAAFAKNAGEAAGGIRTTLDIHVQQKCENLLAGLCGADGSAAGADAAACIVSCADTGEILAAASYPVFDPERIADYLADDCADDGCLLNRVTQGVYPPGSVFKLAVAAAALENGICDASQCFTCCKTAEVEGITLSCSTAGEKGHGSLDMKEAMAVSCNCYFAQLGDLVGYERILDTARKLGFGEAVLTEFPGEAAGNVPDVRSCGEWDTANLSIGQGDLLVTPLQVHRMTSLIAGGEEGGSLRLLYEDSSGRKEQEGLFDTAAAAAAPPRQPGRAAISEKTAETLRQLMAEVMKTGTGSRIAWDIPVWGKSGTAEASRSGRAVKQCWFTGFCETDGEKVYVITVLAENGTSGSAAALPVFRELTETLTELRP